MRVRAFVGAPRRPLYGVTHPRDPRSPRFFCAARGARASLRLLFSKQKRRARLRWSAVLDCRRIGILLALHHAFRGRRAGARHGRAAGRRIRAAGRAAGVLPHPGALQELCRKTQDREHGSLSRGRPLARQGECERGAPIAAQKPRIAWAAAIRTLQKTPPLPLFCRRNAKDASTSESHGIATSMFPSSSDSRRSRFARCSRTCSTTRFGKRRRAVLRTRV